MPIYDLCSWASPCGCAPSHYSKGYRFIFCSAVIVIIEVLSEKGCFRKITSGLLFDEIFVKGLVRHFVQQSLYADMPPDAIIK